jgi:hypothetical protein
VGVLSAFEVRLLSWSIVGKFGNAEKLRDTRIKKSKPGFCKKGVWETKVLLWIDFAHARKIYNESGFVLRVTKQKWDFGGYEDRLFKSRSTALPTRVAQSSGLFGKKRLN